MCRGIEGVKLGQCDSGKAVLGCTFGLKGLGNHDKGNDITRGRKSEEEEEEEKEEKEEKKKKKKKKKKEKKKKKKRNPWNFN
ncbi:hypothetical protein E2C01_030777 [Portunus trituberculatus]|uniref:Uncharacterized protein n=1 Tax=Portunus trituberculatus TaxID=210409 RepID=A0A5B7ESS7_PORTR|nr:hypothetical protein [Portunus trituberculatus]